MTALRLAIKNELAGYIVALSWSGAAAG